MRQVGLNACASVLIVLAAPFTYPQTGAAPSDQFKSDPLTKMGQVAIDGRTMPYVIHYLPPSSFPNLPANVVDVLNRRGCMIPQTYEAHHPENVVHASLERAGSQDWALLCSAKSTVSLMVFFASAPESPMILVATPETERLQVHGASQALGFDWGIDPASPERVHEAQIGLERRPPPPDHDAIANSVIDQRTAYYLYSKTGKWTLVDLPEP
jgi:hypothetical protein